MTNADRARKWRQENPEKVAVHAERRRALHSERDSEYQRQWREKNKERRKRTMAAWKEANKERIQESKLLRKYGIDKAEYQRMLAAQGGVCAICKTADAKALCVDHDHVTGRVRGLLCGNCNTSLGGFMDSPARLASAIEYLSSTTH